MTQRRTQQASRDSVYRNRKAGREARWDHRGASLKTVHAKLFLWENLAIVLSPHWAICLGFTVILFSRPILCWSPVRLLQRRQEPWHRRTDPIRSDFSKKPWALENELSKRQTRHYSSNGQIGNSLHPFPANLKPFKGKRLLNNNNNNNKVTSLGCNTCSHSQEAAVTGAYVLFSFPPILSACEQVVFLRLSYMSIYLASLISLERWYIWVTLRAWKIFSHPATQEIVPTISHLSACLLPCEHSRHLSFLHPNFSMWWRH